MLAIDSRFIPPLPINDIPNEIYYEILSKLKTKSWYSASLVCKQWDFIIREVAKIALNREIKKIIKGTDLLGINFCLTSSNLYIGIIKFQLKFSEQKYCEHSGILSSACKILKVTKSRNFVKIIDDQGEVASLRVRDNEYNKAFWHQRYKYLLQRDEYELASEIAIQHLDIFYTYVDLHKFEMKLFIRIIVYINLESTLELKYLNKVITNLFNNEKILKFYVCLVILNKFLISSGFDGFSKDEYIKHKKILSSIIKKAYDMHLLFLIKKPKYSWGCFKLWCKLTYNFKKWKKYQIDQSLSWF